MTRGARQRSPAWCRPTRERSSIPATKAGQIGTNPSFSPRTGLFYVPTWVNYSSVYFKQHVDFVEGRLLRRRDRHDRPFRGNRTATNDYHTEEEGYGAIRAIDPKTGERKWEYKMTDLTDAGILTTASDLLFSGGREVLSRWTARTGAPLWKVTVGGAVASGPITYAVGGRQYVSVAAGNAVFAFALPE